MKRSQAADLIDKVREALSVYELHGSAESLRLDLLEALRRVGLKPLEPCDGEAHSNAFIDNCMRCAPRWGWIGKKEPVT